MAGSFDDILNAFAESGGGHPNEENPLTQASHPAVIAALRTMLENRGQEREELIAKFGGDEEAAKDYNNPKGIQCGLVDAIIAIYTGSPYAMISLMIDRMRGQIDPTGGDPGKFFHEMGHMLFDLGQAFERLRIIEQIAANGIPGLEDAPVAKKGSWEQDEPDEEDGEEDASSPFAGFLTTLKFASDDEETDE